MRKSLLFASLIFAMFCVACGDNADEALTPMNLALESEQDITFNESGGGGTILYSLTEATRASKPKPAEVSVDCQAEWIRNFDITPEAINFLVEAMDFDAEPRHGVIVVSYLDQSFSVNVHQVSSRPDYHVTMEAQYINGTYYGKSGSSGYNYTVTLSDKGVPNRGSYYYDSYAYTIELFSEVSHGFSTAPQKLPNGVYTFDRKNTGDPGTFMSNPDYSYFVDAYNGSVSYYGIIDGTITVTDDYIDASLRTDNGQWHHVTYSGDLTLTYDYIASIQRPYTRLTENFSENYTACYLHSYYRGDYFGLGCDVWYVDMSLSVRPMNGTYVMLMLMVDPSKGYTRDAFLGEYTVASEGMDDYSNTFIAGDLRNGYEPVNSWLLTCENSMILNTWGGPIKDGKVNIDFVDGYYVVTLDCVDDGGHEIKCSFSCIHDGYLNQDFENPDLVLQ